MSQFWGNSKGVHFGGIWGTFAPFWTNQIFPNKPFSAIFYKFNLAMELIFQILSRISLAPQTVQRHFSTVGNVEKYQWPVWGTFLDISRHFSTVGNVEKCQWPVWGTFLNISRQSEMLMTSLGRPLIEVLPSYFYTSFTNSHKNWVSVRYPGWVVKVHSLAGGW